MKKFLLFIFFSASILQGNEFLVEGELLYWTACSEGFFYAIDRKGVLETEVENGILTTIFYDFKKPIRIPSHDADTGFRIGASYTNTNCSFETRLSWLSFSTWDSKRLISDSPSMPSYSQFTSFRIGADAYFYTTQRQHSLRANEVKGAWDLNLDLVELEWSPIGFEWGCFMFNPHLDLQYVSVEQGLKINAEGEIIDIIAEYFLQGDAFLADYTSKERINVDYRGIGPRLGLKLEWDLFCNVGLYGNIATSLNYGRQHNHSKVVLERFNAIALGANGDLHFKERRKVTKWCTRANTDISLGLFWNGEICDCGPVALVKLGWELHHFHNLGLGGLDGAYYSNISRDSNNLYTQGLTASFAIIY